MDKRIKSGVVACIMGLGLASSAAAECGVIVFFENGQSGIGSGAAASLSEYIATNPSVQVAVTGYASAPGDAAANQRLSQRRAQAVASVLQNQSGATVVSVTGAGEAVRPDTSGPDDPRNRRVEVVDTSCEGGLFASGPAPAATAVLAGNTGLAVAAGVAGLGLLAAAGGGGDDDAGGGTGTGTQ